MTQLVAWAALVVSIVGTVFAWQSAKASRASAKESRRSADAASAEDRRARTPNLEVICQSKAGYEAGEDAAIYEVINHGPEHLASVVVYSPKPDNGINYKVAATGLTDYQDEAEIGPIEMTRSTRFTLCIGSWHQGEQLPEFRVLLKCTATNGDWWELPYALSPPRTRPTQISSAAFTRGRIKRDQGR